MANNIKGDVSHHIEDLTRTAKMHMTHHNQNPAMCQDEHRYGHA